MAKTPKVRCPMSGRYGGRFGGGLDQCEHCGKMVYHAERDGRVSKHYLPARSAKHRSMWTLGSPGLTGADLDLWSD